MPVILTVAAFTLIPVKLPVVAVPCWLAFNVNAPSTVVALAPDANVMSRAVVRAIVPAPLVARSLEVFGRLIVLAANPARLLPDASVIAPLKVIVLNSPPS